MCRTSGSPMIGGGKLNMRASSSPLKEVIAELGAQDIRQETGYG